MVRAIIDQGQVISRYERTTGSASSVKLPLVCEPCNNGWMSQIETGAANQLRDALAGTAISIDLEGQKNIATWMALKALTFDLGEPNPFRVVTEADLSELFQDRCPPPQLRAWVARYDGNPKHLTFYARQPFVHPESVNGAVEGDPHAQSLTLVFGKLVVQSIYVPLAGRPFPMAYDRPDSLHDHAIWPGPGRTVVWPPSLALTERGLTQYAYMPMSPASLADWEEARVVRHEALGYGGPE